MKMSPTWIWITHFCLYVDPVWMYVWVMLMELVSCVSHHFLYIVITRKVSWSLESRSHMKW
jgi:hypothetical protein